MSIGEETLINANPPLVMFSYSIKVSYLGVVRSKLA